jgi:hypothetical protein
MVALELLPLWAAIVLWAVVVLVPGLLVGWWVARRGRAVLFSGAVLVIAGGVVMVAGQQVWAKGETVRMQRALPDEGFVRERRLGPLIMAWDVIYGWPASDIAPDPAGRRVRSGVERELTTALLIVPSYVCGVWLGRRRVSSG